MLYFIWLQQQEIHGFTRLQGTMSWIVSVNLTMKKRTCHLNTYQTQSTPPWIQTQDLFAVKQ